MRAARVPQRVTGEWPQAASAPSLSDGGRRSLRPADEITASQRRKEPARGGELTRSPGKVTAQYLGRVLVEIDVRVIPIRFMADLTYLHLLDHAKLASSVRAGDDVAWLESEQFAQPESARTYKPQLPASIRRTSRRPSAADRFPPG